MHLQLDDDPLEADKSGLTTALIQMVGPDTARKLVKDIYRGEKAARVQARIRQRQRAKELRLADKHHAMKRTGARYIAEIDFASFLYWKEREGMDCWKDRTFLKEYLRDNEDVRVTQATGGATNRVAWTRERDATLIVAAGKYTRVS